MNTNTWSAKFVLPSIAQAAEPVIGDLLAQLQEQHCWSDHDIFGIHLSLEEALTNAMEHGNRWDPAKQVEIVFHCSPSYLRIEILDQGPGFDPATVPDPSHSERLACPRGRGLFIMRHYMTRVQYLDFGNRLVLEKTRESQANVA